MTKIKNTTKHIYFKRFKKYFENFRENGTTVPIWALPRLQKHQRHHHFLVDVVARHRWDGFPGIGKRLSANWKYPIWHYIANERIIIILRAVACIPASTQEEVDSYREILDIFEYRAGENSLEAARYEMDRDVIIAFLSRVGLVCGRWVGNILVSDVFRSNVWIHGISLQENEPNYVKLFSDLCFENEKWF